MTAYRREELRALADKVEKLEGPDRGVDALIRCTVYNWWELNIRPAKRLGWVTAKYDGGSHGTWIAPWFTRSLDAARALVPEGWTYEAYQGPSGRPHKWKLKTIRGGDQRYTEVEGKGATPAAALTAAALRALAEGEG